MKKSILLFVIFLSASYAFCQEAYLNMGYDNIYVEEGSEYRIVPQEEEIVFYKNDAMLEFMFSYPLEINVEIIGPTLIESISLSKTEIVLRPGETDYLWVVFEPIFVDNTDVIWSSDDESVATVEDGTITAVGHGVINITATSVEGGHTASCEVTVLQMAGTFTDERDGVTYNWVRIGEKIWMAENLKFFKWINEKTEISLDEPKYYVYGVETPIIDIDAIKSSVNYRTYGVLYNWEATQGACPDGWRLPKNGDWTEIINLIGGDLAPQEVAKLKATGGWNDGGSGSDEFGFRALPGGMLEYEGYMYVGDRSYWWTQTEFQGGDISAYNKSIQNGSTRLMSFIENKARGLSVRCVKDED